MNCMPHGGNLWHKSSPFYSMVNRMSKTTVRPSAFVLLSLCRACIPAPWELIVWRFACWVLVGWGHDQSWALISSNSLMKRPHCYKHTAPSLLEGSLRSQWSAICIKMLTWLRARHGHTGRAVTVLCPGLQRRSLTQLGSVWILWPEARVRNRPALAFTVLHPIERSGQPAERSATFAPWIIWTLVTN